MAQSTPQLTRRTLVLAKIETTPGTDAVPAAATDALLVATPDFSVDLTTLERNFVRDDLSPLGTRVGRKLAKMKFSVECRGNGVEFSGNTTDAPKIGRLLRGCGFAETGLSGAGTVGAVRPIGVHPAAATWVAANTNSNPTCYDFQITCVLGGASATAKLRVCDLNGKSAGFLKYERFTATAASAAGTVTVNATNPLSVTYTIGGTWLAGDRLFFDVGGYGSFITIPGGGTATTAIATQLATAMGTVGGPISASPSASIVTVTFTGSAAGTTITSGTTALTLGELTVTETPTWSGNLTLGQYWKVSVSAPGIGYTPVSTNFETLTLYMYMDGNLHKMTNAQGTFSLKSDAGSYGTFDFEFTGQYVAPIDANFPTGAVYESTVPPVFELAQLRADSEDITIQSLSYTQNNTIAPRPDANSADGYVGVRITGRNPQGGVNPESAKVGDYDFWTKLAGSSNMPFSCRFGSVAGNVVWMRAPSAMYTGLTYADRDGLRVFDAGLLFTREQGNDEVQFVFA